MSTIATEKPKSLPKIKKRNGDVVKFEISKIKNGILRSAKDAGHDINGRFDSLIDSIISEASESKDTIDSKSIQDIIKRKLMDFQFHKVAESFILFSDKQNKMRAAPDMTLISDYVTLTRYSRYDESKKRREIFVESMTRVEDMHLARFPQIADDIKWAINKAKNKEVLPSMRSLQFGGRAQELNHAKGYNCSFSVCNRAKFFSEALWLLLSGTGVGFSVQFHHVDELPEVQFVRRDKVKHYIIPDTIEGWSDAAYKLIESYLYTGEYVEFSYSDIRPQGTPLKTSGGKAPGHLPLKTALDRVRGLLDNAQGRHLNPIECLDIMCMLADAVYAGGIREAAMLCLFSLDDGEMMNAKTGRWSETHPWRARCNNSVVLLRKDVKRRQYDRIFKATRQWGEPGFYFTDDEDTGPNPCCEISLNPKLEITPEIKIWVERWAKKTNRKIPKLKVGQEFWGWQMCVGGETQLITKDGIEHISNSVGKNIEIWNGNEWSEVTPFVTGHNRKLYRVEFGDGSYLDCTDNHKFLVADRFNSDYVEVMTKDLMNFSKYPIHTPRVEVVMVGGKNEPNAYEYGFFLADGYLHDHQNCVRAEAKLFGKKIALPLNGHRYGDDEICFELDIDKCKQLKGSSLPKWLFSLDRESILKFIAGWADGDGSKTKNGCRIYGSDTRIKDLQLLLTKAGINCSINTAYEKGELAELPGGRTCVRNKSIWYAQICGSIPTNRFITSGKPSFKNKWQIIKSVSQLDGEYTTYCLEEKSNHTCLFNNVITKQCNLSEINAATAKTAEELYNRARAASILGTIQAGYTDFPYLGWISEAICNREALLGVSMTGIMDNPSISLDPEIQRNAAQIVIETNMEIAAKIGINPAARATCVKPSGTASLVLGVSSGIHAHHAIRYLRRIRANPKCKIYQEFKRHNPHMCTSINEYKDLITFPVKAPEGALTRHDLTAIEFLDKITSTMKNWVIPGTARPNSSPGISHNVSNTITVKENEWNDVMEYIWKHRQYISGISLLADDGDKVYANAPNEEVKTDTDETNWMSLISNYKPIDWTKFVEEDDNTSLMAEKACAGGVCAL